MYSPYMGMWGAVLGWIMGFLAFIIILAVVCYILYAMGLYTTAKRRDIDNPWLAWIPVANVWLLGKLADAYNGRFENKQSNWATLMLVFAILTFVLCLIPIVSIVGILLAIPLAVFEFIAFYKIYNWNTQNAVLWTVLSVIFAIIIPFVLFFTRNGDNPHLVGDGAPQQEQQQQPQDNQPPQE